MKTYTLKSSDKKSPIALAYLALCAAGKPGEILVRSGCSKEAFCLFAADIALRAVEAGQSKEELAKTFGTLAIQNQSQVRQLIGSFTIWPDGDEDEAESLSKFWGGDAVEAPAPSDILKGLGL